MCTGKTVSWHIDAGETQEFVGLTNQGATCYMNSLLQTLYMTPEFRSEIYKWEFDPERHGDPALCIPLQLQNLFGKLQLSGLKAVETTELTRSFGWDSREGFQQHDVQEFCRVLFDAIEQSVGGTLQSDFIKTLYEGQFIDYVQCMSCLNESTRVDKFLDLSLTVKNQFERVYNDSVEKAIRNYIKPEELTGDNQYFCGHCAAKKDAQKGLKFKELPRILMLQLNRFDLDYNTLQRVKLNDLVSFPFILNMNPYMKHLQRNCAEDESVEGCNNAHDLPDFTESLRTIEKYKKEGEFVYELYSVMIHSGSALGGHYYTYIKSKENSTWYNFNDSTVREMREKDIEKVFGGSKDSYGTCAYLLTYRKVSDQPVPDTEVPQHALDSIEREKEVQRLREAAREERAKNTKLTLIYQGQERTVQVRREAALGTLREKAAQEFKLQLFSEEDIRLRAATGYRTFREVLDLTKNLEQLGLYPSQRITVETRNVGEDWEQYDPDQITLNIHLWDEGLASSEEPYEAMTRTPVPIKINKHATLRNLRTKIEEQCRVPKDSQVLLKSGHRGGTRVPEILSFIDHGLYTARILDGTSLFLEEGTEDSSKWYSILQNELRKLTVKFNHPDSAVSSYGQVEYREDISIDSAKSVHCLKLKLSEYLGIPVNELLVRRGSQCGSELKDLELSIRHANIMNNGLLFIERGIPCTPGETRIVFYLAGPPSPSGPDGACFSFKQLLAFPVSSTVALSQLRSQLHTEINNQFPSTSPDPSSLQLREKTCDQLGRLITSNEYFSAHPTTRQREIAVQITSEAVPDNEVFIVVKKFSPSTWGLSAAQEFHINKYWKLKDLGGFLSGAFSVPLKHIEITRITCTQVFCRTDLQAEQFVPLYKNTAHLASSPFFLSSEGGLFVIKDSTEITAPFRVPRTRHSPKETSVRITVINH